MHFKEEKLIVALLGRVLALWWIWAFWNCLQSQHVTRNACNMKNHVTWKNHYPFFSLENDKKVLQVNLNLSLLKIIDLHVEIKSYFLRNASFDQHRCVRTQNHNRNMIIVYACQYVHDIVSTLISVCFELQTINQHIMLRSA